MLIREFPPTRVVEVFADVTCPFAHVGLRRLVEARERLGRPDVVVRVRAWPLELVNGEPLHGDAVAEKVRALRATVAADLFHGFDPTRFPSTSLPALGLVARAYGRNDQTGERASLALRDALYEAGRDVSDPREIAAIARRLDLTPPDADAREVVRADWEEGRRRGVSGSPHFFVAGQGFFCPALTIEHVGSELRVAFDTEGFDALLRAVFGRTCTPAA